MTRRYENPSWNQGPADLSDFDDLTTLDAATDGIDVTTLPAPNRPARRFQDAATVILPNDRTATILEATWGDGEWIYEVRQRHVAGTFRYAEHELEAAR